MINDALSVLSRRFAETPEVLRVPVDMSLTLVIVCEEQYDFKGYCLELGITSSGADQLDAKDTLVKAIKEHIERGINKYDSSLLRSISPSIRDKIKPGYIGVFIEPLEIDGLGPIPMLQVNIY